MKNTIIALDLDATLLHDNHTISPRTIDVLKKLQQQGATIVVSTSRDVVNANTYAKIINADFVCSNGGNMITTPDGTILFEFAFPQDLSKDFINTFYDNITSEIYIDSANGFFGKYQDAFSEDWILNIATKEDLLNLNAIKLFIKKNESWNKQVLEYCEQKEFTCRDVRDFEFFVITQKNTDKYYALQKIMNKLNKTTLFAFGDDYSDLISIQNATYGVAMANSRPEVLAGAKYVTKSNNEDGVAEFLEQFLYIQP